MKNIHKINENIYITSDEEIKDVRPHKGRWHLEKEQILNKFPDYLTDLSECKLIILTTDQDLINVQAIDDEFLEWFVKNPSCEEVEIVKTAPIRPFGSLYKIIIPKEEAKKKHIVMLIGDKVNEEQTKCYCGHTTYCDCGPEEPKQETLLGKTISKKDADKDSFEDVTKYKIERSYSEEEVIEILRKALTYQDDEEIGSLVTAQREIRTANFFSWFEQFKKK